MLKQLLLLPLLPPPLLFRIVWANLLTIRFLYHMVVLFLYSLECKKLSNNIIRKKDRETFTKCIMDIYEINIFYFVWITYTRKIDCTTQIREDYISSFLSHWTTFYKICIFIVLHARPFDLEIANISYLSLVLISYL